MSDILEDITVHVDCAQCDGSFDIAASVVAESQELLEEGCPGTDYECPASLFAELVDRDALRQLAGAWRAIEDSVRDSIGQVSLQAHPTLERLLSSVEDADPDDSKTVQSRGPQVTLNVGRGRPQGE